MSNQDEATVMNTIQQKWIFRFGAPGYIHVDRGKVFESKRFLKYARSMLIEIRFSSPYHHSANGIIERQFRTIRDALNASLRQKIWKKLGWIYSQKSNLV